MPNWCANLITIHSDDKKLLKKVYEELEDCQKIDVCGFHGAWLGNLLIKMGKTIDEINAGDINCRGSITYLEFNGDEIIMDTETAWAPMVGVVRLFCDRYCTETGPRLEYIYQAEEPGCELYMTNDPTVMDNYLLDVWGDDLPAPLSDYVYSMQEFPPDGLKHMLSDTLGHDGELDDLIAECLEKFGDSVGIHQYEYVPVEDIY